MRWVSYTRSISSRIGEENPANTIAEQNANIEQYLKNKGYRISEKYSDRKRSAEAADGFDRMVQDGMTQKFDAVAVDSIFRFGKTLPFAIEVLQKTFYPVGIQFAVVEDDFCSTDRTADEVEQYFKEKAIEKIRFEFISVQEKEGDNTMFLSYCARKNAYDGSDEADSSSGFYHVRRRKDGKRNAEQRWSGFHPFYQGEGKLDCMSDSGNRRTVAALI